MGCDSTLICCVVTFFGPLQGVLMYPGGDALKWSNSSCNLWDLHNL
jgi:hypothetical protein